MTNDSFHHDPSPFEVNIEANINGEVVYRNTVKLSAQKKQEYLDGLLELIDASDPTGSLETDESKGVFLIIHQRYEEALQLSEQIIARAPDRLPSYLFKASVLQLLNRQEEALACIEQNIHLDPNNVQAHYIKASLLTELQRHQEAQEENAVAQRLAAPSDYKDGMERLEKQEYQEALQFFEDGIRCVASYAPNYYGKGLALQGLQRSQEALEAWKQAILLDSKMVAAYEQQITVLLDLGQYEEALVAFDQALLIDPSKAWLYGGKAGVLLSLQRYEEAFHATEYALQLSLDDGDVYTVYTLQLDALISLQRYEEALATLDHALQRYEALATLDHARRLFPDQGYLYHQKGNILTSLGRRREANRAYKRAARPGHPR